MNINCYFKPACSMLMRQCYSIVGEVGFIYHGKVTSYKIAINVMYIDRVVEN